MTGFDARVNAWVIAYQLMEFAVKARDRCQEPGLSEALVDRASMLHSHLVDEAQVFTQLAAVPESMVGWGAGAWMATNYEEKIQEREYLSTVMKDVFGDTTKKDDKDD